MSYLTGRQTLYRPMAAAALANAMHTSRKGKCAPLREQRSGRLDRGRLARVGVGDTRVFIKKGAPQPDKVRVTILVDASSSMTSPIDYRSYDRKAAATVAAQTSRDLADATEMLPWVTADVVAFTTSGNVDLYPLWKSGDPTSDIDSYYNISMGGTEEGWSSWYGLREKALASLATLTWENANEPLPPFKLTDLSGKTWTLADLKGKVTFLNFWASW